MKLLIAFILFVIAIGLYILLFPLIVIEITYRALGGVETLDRYLYRVARSIDQTGNATYPVVFTLACVKWWTGKRVVFGNEDETISSVLGKNARIESLSVFGRRLSLLLEWLDEEHLEKAIEEDEF